DPAVPERSMASGAHPSVISTAGEIPRDRAKRSRRLADAVPRSPDRNPGCAHSWPVGLLAGISAMVALALVDAVAGAHAALDGRQPGFGGMQPLGAACRALGLVAGRAGIDTAVCDLGPGFGLLIASLLGLQQRLGLGQRLFGCDGPLARPAAGRVRFSCSVA